MIVTFTKLTNPTPEITKTINQWTNDPSLIPFIRPNRNRNELDERVFVTVESLLLRLGQHPMYLIYVDGQLKESLSVPPFFWKWNERAFLKHTLETKVYDHEGNSASSGEKEFYIFNPINRLK